MTPDPLTLGLELREPELERSYRRSRLSGSRPWALALFASVCIPVVVFAVSDFQLFGFTRTFRWLLAVRLEFLLGTAVAVVVTLRSGSPPVVERVAIVWGAHLIVFLAIVNMTRPSRYLGNVTIDVLVVLGAYIALPTRWGYQLAVGLSATLASLGILAALRDISSPVTWNAIIVGYVVANILGATASGRLHCSDRQRFAAFEHNRASRELISVLWSIVPMCSGCKRVRDSGGQWHDVETYIAAETGSEVSHGLCPGCLERLYPEYSVSAKT